jgi:hypothetical protein
MHVRKKAATFVNHRQVEQCIVVWREIISRQTGGAIAQVEGEDHRLTRHWSQWFRRQQEIDMRSAAAIRGNRRR